MLPVLNAPYETIYHSGFSQPLPFGALQLLNPRVRPALVFEVAM